MNNNKIINLALIICFVITLYSCTSTGNIYKNGDCPPNPPIGSLGSLFNSNADEMQLSKFQNSLVYIREITSNQKKSTELVMIDPKGKKETINNFPFSNLQNPSTPVFFENPKEGLIEAFFSAEPKSGKRNRDIYYTRFFEDKWTKPVSVDDKINTNGFEAMPAIAPDGSYLVFVSDREGSMGETDLYISFRDNYGNFGEPKNLGSSINSARKESFPFISSDGTLYYCSNNFLDTLNFDLIKATMLKNGEWSNPKALPAPFNSSSNDVAPFVTNGKIFFGSNRRGGCGGYDLYGFDLCSAIEFQGTVRSETGNMPLSGNAMLYDFNQNLISQTAVDWYGKFKFELKAGENYLIKYVNSCVPEFNCEQKLKTSCNDEKIVVLKQDFILPKGLKEFSFEKYDVPFFVSGYYIPNTSSNLKELRLKFTYNLIGNSDSSKYIEYPNEEYDAYSLVVDEALNSAIEFILNRLGSVDRSCNAGRERIVIKVTGYADPRKLSPNASYIGASIDDSEMNFKVKSGEKLNNSILSDLRAYYTAKTLENLLRQNTNIDKSLLGKIKWSIAGRGIDNNAESSNEQKRRVSIQIGLQSE